MPKGLPYNTLQIVALLLVLIAGLWYLGSSPPSMTGDGLDYFHQLQSLFNHFSLDLREKDVTDFETVRAKSSFGPLKVANMHYNYRQTPDSNYYSFHFFTYPLAALPVKTLLHAIGSDEMRALEVTNVLFILLLMVVGLNTERHRILFLLTFIVGPILWYLKWPGPEVMLYCLFLLSLLLSQQGRHVASFFCAAIAASQFILFIPWVLILLWRNIHLLRIERASAKRYLLILAVTLLAFSSPLWYFWKFQSFSLLVSAGAAQKEYITSSKILSLLFDFNSGVLVFYPGLIVGVVLIARRVTSIAMLGFLFTIFYLTVSTSQVNWNSGMNMINRYSLMIVPIVLFFIYRWVVSRSLLDLRRLALICGFFMLNNASFVYSSTHRYAYTEFSPIAKLVMAKFPGAYNPEREIFSERALHAEVDARSPIIHDISFREHLLKC
ncbi:MAG: hypothetical protein HY277_01695 [Ignavibacteriales bacterium]|nr:hypothetical protein [Ignavibacteriales bacterium]